MPSIRGIVTVLTVVVVLVLGHLGVGWWRDRQIAKNAEAQAQADAAAAQVAAIADSLRTTWEELDRALAGGRAVLTAPVPHRPILRRPVTPSPAALDTMSVDSLKRIIVEQGGDLDSLALFADSVEARLVVVLDTLEDVIRASERFQGFADSTITAQARQIVAMQVVIDTPRPARRLGLGVACGYGAVLSGTLLSGPSCTVGATYSLKIPFLN